jgi:hypothetical protein
MKDTLNAEAHVLDRIMSLLEENSVQFLVLKDDKFASYIDSLYTQIGRRSRDLRGRNA